MKLIGITGGVGAGKSEVLKYLKDNYNCRIVLTDEVAHEVRDKGGECYDAICSLLGPECIAADGNIIRTKMAEKIFSDDALLKKVNSIIHPAVKSRVIELAEMERTLGKIDFLFLESALLLDDGYDKICDEIWYIYVRDEVRRSRLKASRGYTDDKIDSILARQKSDEEFRKGCKWTIDNSDELELTASQIKLLLGR